ncbi:MAG: 5-deoxy-glucuronate isomerase, partial [Acetatifactor sp.]|nr:5-deoxy-glucuronate isomerase [Acetatifactor sp.]
MYENPVYNQRGEKILCEETGKNSHMLMDVRVQRLEAGQTVRILEQEKETAVMLLAGKVVFAFEGKRENAERRSVFLDKPYCLHCCHGKEMSVTAVEDSRLLIQQTTNPGEFDT